MKTWMKMKLITFGTRGVTNIVRILTVSYVGTTTGEIQVWVITMAKLMRILIAFAAKHRHAPPVLPECLKTKAANPAAVSALQANFLTRDSLTASTRVLRATTKARSLRHA